MPAHSSANRCCKKSRGWRRRAKASRPARPAPSACAEAPRAIRQFAETSGRAAVSSPVSEAAVRAPDLCGNFFAQPENDKECETRKTAAGCRSGPGPFSSARRDNRENHRRDSSARRGLFPGRGNPRAPDDKRSGCGARRCARLQGNAGTPRRAGRGSYGRTQRLLGLFDGVAASRGLGAIAILALEDRRRTHRNEFDFLQHKLRIEAVAPGVVNGVAAETAPHFVFVVDVDTKIELLPVGRELFLFVEDDQLRRAPRLARLADIAPEFVLRDLEVAAPDKVIAGRLSLDVCRGGRAGLLIS